MHCCPSHPENDSSLVFCDSAAVQLLRALFGLGSQIQHLASQHSKEFNFKRICTKWQTGGCRRKAETLKLSEWMKRFLILKPLIQRKMNKSNMKSEGKTCGTTNTSHILKILLQSVKNGDVLLPQFLRSCVKSAQTDLQATTLTSKTDQFNSSTHF